MSMVNQNKSKKEKMIQNIQNLEEKIQDLNISEKPASSFESVKDLIDEIHSKRGRNYYEKEKLEKIISLKLKLESWIKKIIMKVKKNQEMDHFNLNELIFVLKDSVNEVLRGLQSRPDHRVLYETNKKMVIDVAKVGKSSAFSKLMQKEKIKNEEIFPAELDFVDEVFEQKKKSFFTPLLEKTLKKTN